MKKRWRGASIGGCIGACPCRLRRRTGRRADASSGTAAADGTERKEFTTVYSAELAHINYLKSSLNTLHPFRGKLCGRSGGL